MTVRCPACHQRFKFELPRGSAGAEPAKPRSPVKDQARSLGRPAGPRHEPKALTARKSVKTSKRNIFLLLVLLLGLVGARLWLDRKARSFPYPYWLAASDRGVAVLYGKEFFVVDHEGAIQLSQELPDDAEPCQILWHGDDIWVSDWKNKSIRSYSNGSWDTIHLNGPQIDAQMNVAVDPFSGNLFVTDSQGNRILVYDSEGAFIREFGQMGRSAGKFFFPKDVAFDHEGQLIIGNKLRPSVDAFNKEGTFVKTMVKPQGNPLFLLLSDFAVGDQNIVTLECNLLITDCLVAEYDQQGRLLQSMPQVPGELAAGDVAVWGDRIYVSDCQNRRVNVFAVKDLERIGPLSPELDARGQELNEKAGLYRQMSSRSIYLIAICFIVMLWYYIRLKKHKG